MWQQEVPGVWQEQPREKHLQGGERALKKGQSGSCGQIQTESALCSMAVWGAGAALSFGP